MAARNRHGIPPHLRRHPVPFPHANPPPSGVLDWHTTDSTTYTSSADATSQSSLNGAYEPSLSDVQAVSDILDKVLVPDLTPDVLELARYWVRETAARNTQMMVTERDKGRMYIKTRGVGWSTLQQQSGREGEGVEEVQAEGEEGEGEKETGAHVARHVKMVVFKIRSHDQGWSDYRQDYGTYRNSHTWFTASVKRSKKKTDDGEATAAPVQATNGEGVGQASTPEDEEGEEVVGTHRLMTNVHCSSSDNTHTITWSLDTNGILIVGDNPQPTEQQTQQNDAKTETQPGQYTAQERKEIVDLLRSIQEGDTIEVNVWAKYPGWKNHVAGARVDVYCGV